MSFATHRHAARAWRLATAAAVLVATVVLVTAGTARRQGLAPVLASSSVPTYYVTTLAGNGSGGESGDGGAATQASINGQSVAADGSGGFYIGTSDGVVRHVDSAGDISTVSGLAGDWVTMAGGTLYTDNANACAIDAYDPATGSVSTVTSTAEAAACGVTDMGLPLAVDPAGDIFFTDQAGAGGWVGKYDPATGQTTTYAGQEGSVQVCNTPLTASLPVGCELTGPRDVGIDQAGDVFVNVWEDETIVEINPSDTHMTAVMGGGSNMVEPTDGTPAANSDMSLPYGLAVEPDGSYFVAGTNFIVYVDTAGIIHTIAGNGTRTDSGDGGPAAQAGFNQIQGLGIGPNGTLLVAERYRVRELIPHWSIGVSVTGSGTVSGGPSASPTDISCTAAGGSCTADYPAGTSVTLTATPSSNLEQVTWSGCDSASGDSCVVAASAARSVSTRFAVPAYALSVATSGAGSGTVTTDSGGIACSSPGSGTCSASYALASPATTVTATAAAAAGSFFAGWTGCVGSVGTQPCTLSMDSDRSLVADFELGAPLTAETVGSGTVSTSDAKIDCGTSGTTCIAGYNIGDTVTLEAAPASGYVLQGWNGCDRTSGTTCTVSITSSAGALVQAVFAQPNSYTLHVGVNGHGMVTSNPGVIGCTSGTSTCQDSFTSGTIVTLQAAADPGYNFDGWGGACASAGVASTCTLTVTASTSLTASFSMPSYALTLDITGTGAGTVASSDNAIDCSTTCTRSLPAGTTYSLSATPASGSSFTSWSGACTSAGTTCQTTLSGPTVITVVFSVIPQVSVSVSLTGAGQGVVRANSGAINCGAGPNVCVDQFTRGASVTLTAIAASGSTFAGWSDCPGAAGAACTLSALSGAVTVGARFDTVVPPTTTTTTTPPSPSTPPSRPPSSAPPSSAPPMPPARTVQMRAGVSQNLPSSQSSYQPVTHGGDPVNLVFGNFTHQHTDLSSEELLGVHVVRTYDSATPASGPLGYGWSLSYTDHLKDLGATVVVTRGDGRLDVFTRQGDGSYAATPGSQETLARDGDGFLLTTSGGDHWRFDSAGRLAALSDLDNNTLTLRHDSTGQLLAIVDAQHRTWHFSWSCGHVVSVSDPAGRTVRYGYDAAGDLVMVTDPAGGAETMAYDAGHRLVRIVDPNGHLFIANTYDVAGRVIAQQDARGKHTFTYTAGKTTYTDPTGATASVSYDGAYRVTARTDAAGGTEKLHYNAAGLVDEVTDADGGVTSYTFDAAGDTTSVIDPTGDAVYYSYDAHGDRTATSQDGRTVHFAYDGRRHLLSIGDASGTTHYSYDARGEVVRAVAPDGATTSYTYDGAGNRIASTDPLGATTRYGYDALGRQVRQVAPGGRVTSWRYDALGQLVALSAPGGALTRYAYDKAGNRVLVTDALGQRTRYRYDAANDLVAVTDPLGRTTRSTYDGDGRLLSTTLPSGRRTRDIYDAAGRLVATLAPSGARTTYTYDADGRLIAVTDPTGARTRHFYDAAGRPSAVVDPLGAETTYTYRGGLLAAVRDPLGHVTRYAYDASGHRRVVTDPLGNALRLAYDAAGRVRSRTNGAGQRVLYSYDAAGHLVAVRDAAGVVRDGYDAAGDRVLLTDATGTTRYRYDVAGHLVSARTPEGTLSYRYDRLGNRTELVQPGLVTHYRYDAAGELTAVVAGAARVAYRYDPDGRVVLASYGNGVRARYRYDANGELVRLLVLLGGRHLLRLTYRYDARGDLVAAAAAGVRAGALHYRYDAAGRLLAVSGTTGGRRVADTFGYDAAGNRVVVGRTRLRYNAADEIVAPGYRYDRAGQLVAAAGRQLRYSPEGQLVDAGSTRFAYDGNANRVGVGGTKLLVDTAAPLALRVAAGRSAYAYGVGAFAVIRGTDVSYLVDGLLGSPVLLTSAAGAVRAVPVFSALGAGAPAAALGMSGAPLDAGLLYLRARTYDPRSGTFLTPDPRGQVVGDPTSTNPYTYGADSPTTVIDPTGMFGIGDVLGGIGAAFGGAVSAVTNALGGIGAAVTRYENQNSPDASSAKGSGDAAAGSGTDNVAPLIGQIVVQTAGGQVIAAGGGNFAIQQANGVIGAGAGNLVVDASGQVIAAGGGNVIGAGAGNLVFVDAGGHVIAAGAGNFTVGIMQANSVIAAGAGNLVINAAGVIGAGAGNLIGTQLVASLVGTSSSSLVANSANGVIAAGAGNVIGAGAGN